MVVTDLANLVEKPVKKIIVKISCSFTFNEK